MSVIVTTPEGRVNVKRGTTWSVDPLHLDIFDDAGKVIASFRKWDAVHSPSEPKSAGPFSEPGGCTSDDCIKHHGYPHPAHAADVVDWRLVLETLHTQPAEMGPTVIVRALQQAQLYVMQHANNTP